MGLDDKRWILVVDNDPDLRRAVSLRLQGLGYGCVEAGTGAQAIEWLRRRSFDVVVSDLNMPCGDGIVLADALQKGSRTPIVFMTGFRDEYRRQLRHVDDATVLEKPFDFETLAQLVEAALLRRAGEEDRAEAL